jgi:hypothetical protein
MPETKPRYTVELTTEGWQIKDNVRGTITADVFQSAEKAAEYAKAWSQGDQGEGRR